MRVAIVGSRTVREEYLEKVLEKIPEQCTEIVSGGAKGADHLAELAAERLQVPLKLFLPDYKKYGRAALVKRNEQIVSYCDCLIAVWDYASKGTRNSLLHTVKGNKPVCVIIC